MKRNVVIFLIILILFMLIALIAYAIYYLQTRMAVGNSGSSVSDMTEANSYDDRRQRQLCTCKRTERGMVWTGVFGYLNYGFGMGRTLA
ncbi:hypothetical protein P171DRAFT_525271 [Karstenula rhodostoma CBS 690.94]|uniref:Uncharacterized protein n=1 Tax=Karstenula rhodostoma CBS 690.94 TaxID=1392251 RepID=A0A9P4U7U7_9PLEO|nr:hypothetical protein P171DRAFT_525271 [Karstenula rhodostoma CBS 690.94]